MHACGGKPHPVGKQDVISVEILITRPYIDGFSLVAEVSECEKQIKTCKRIGGRVFKYKIGAHVSE